MSSLTLEAGARQMDLFMSGRVLRRLQSFTDRVQRYNAALGLVRAQPGQLITHHVLDCLAGLSLLETLATDGQGLDLGSGAGFPGLVLAIATPGWHWTLVDRSERRSTFLVATVAELGLCNVQVRTLDARRIEGEFDVAVARAVGTVRQLVALTGTGPRSVARYLLAYKGRSERVDDETRGLPTAAVSVREVIVAGMDAQRHLVTLDLRHPSWQSDGSGRASRPGQ